MLSTHFSVRGNVLLLKTVVISCIPKLILTTFFSSSDRLRRSSECESSFFLSCSYYCRYMIFADVFCVGDTSVNTIRQFNKNRRSNSLHLLLSFGVSASVQNLLLHLMDGREIPHPSQMEQLLTLPQHLRLTDLHESRISMSTILLASYLLRKDTRRQVLI
jgi:hypothetical protein